MKRIAVALALIVLGAPVLPARAAAPNGQFVLRCPYSHSLPDDPIVAPGEPGASHVHDFFGNISVNAFSTTASMLGGETTCRVPSDTAGYWTPAAYLNGEPATPTVMRIYYLGTNAGRLETIPAGLQMVAGNRDATAASENPHVSWNCGQTNNVRTPQRDAPYDCSPWASYPFVDGVVAVIDFPSCWNGSGLRPEDVAYPDAGTCPAGFNHILPKLSERVHLGVMNPLNPDGSLALSLSSGPWYTLHADFWNTWQQERLDQLVSDCLVAAVHCGLVDSTSSIEWSREFGTARYDLAYAAASDGAGGSYVAGFTNLALEGQARHNRSDAFVRRYDAEGTELWTRQFGTSGRDVALALSVSGSDVFVAGTTDGRFHGQEAKGGLDVFVTRFDAVGNQRWITQFGTRRDDEAAATAATPAGTFVGGTTEGTLTQRSRQGPSDAFVVSLDRAGEERWTHQFGGSGDDRIAALHTRGGIVYAAGSTNGLRSVVADQDAFVAWLGTDDGTIELTREVGGVGADAATSVIGRTDGVYLAGWTDGSIDGQTALGGLDAFAVKLDPDSAIAWVRQFGSAADDDAAALAAVGRGLYVAGSTLGELSEGVHLGESDGFLREFLSKNGSEIWTRQFGTEDYDRVFGMASDAKGVVVVGTTHGVLEGQSNAGDRDVFAVRIAFA